MKKDAEFLSAPELQSWLGISKPTLLAWLRKDANPLPGVKIMGRWMFRRQAIMEWWMRQENRRPEIDEADFADLPAKKPRTTKPRKKTAPVPSADLAVEPVAAAEAAPPEPAEPDQPQAPELSSWLRIVSQFMSDEN